MTPRQAATLLAALLSATATPAHAQTAVERGAYLVRIVGCGDCHTPGALLGQPDVERSLAGSNIGFAAPETGIHWGPNLTPDPETGLGNWTEAQIVTAIRTGMRPDGTQVAPQMPYSDFAALTDADALAIAAYLKSLKPIHNRVTDPVNPGAEATATAPYLTVVFPK